MNTYRTQSLLILSFFLIINFLSAQETCDHHDHNSEHISTGDRIGFVQNKGQWDPAVQYQANLGGLNTLFLEDNAFTYLFHDEDQTTGLHDAYYKTDFEEYLVNTHAYKVRFLGANSTAALLGQEKRQMIVNFFHGNDQSKWASNIGVFDKVSYQNIYDHIHLDAYSDGSNFKYDFVVKPTGDVNQIQLQYDGVDALNIRDGKLILTTSVETIKEMEPYAYQLINEKKEKVICNYVLNNNTITFHFPEGYDQTQTLIIDPVVVASTLSGTTISQNFGHTATFDNAGNIYAGGISFGPGYPAGTGAFQTDFAGGFTDICVSKYNPTGTQMLYATYIGGSNNDYPHSMVADFNGQLYIYGSSSSSNYPTTNNAVQANHGGDFDIIVTKLNTDGTQLVGSTYLGGGDVDGLNQSNELINPGDEFRGEIILDPQGNAYISSHSSSPDFPVTNNAYSQNYNSNDGPTGTIAQDAIVAKFNSDLSNLYWSTFLGGDGADTGAGLRVDDDNNVYVTGTAGHSNFPNAGNGYQSTHLGGVEDAYVALLSADGSDLLNSTFYGTSNNEHAYFIDIDEQDNIHIYGQTTGVITPSPAGTYSTNNDSPQFLAAFDRTLGNLIYQTNIGNGPLPAGTSVFQFVPVALMVDKCDNIYFSGYYADAGLPTTADAINNGPTGGSKYFYLGVLEPLASALSYGTYFGNADHVDGGTSRFDKSGTVYQGVCSCTWTNAVLNTNADAWSTTSNLDCDVGVFKIDFEVPTVTAAAFASPGTSGCLPFEVDFTYTGQDAENYYWDFGDGTDSNLENVSHTYTSSGKFIVTMIASSPNSCNISDTFFLQIDVLDGSSTLQDTAICEGGTTLFLDATTLNAQYSWQDGSTSPTYAVNETGIYWVEIDIGGCTRLDSFIINPASSLMVDLGENLSVCDQGSVLIEPAFSGPAQSFQWSNGATTEIVQISSSGTYTLTITDDVGCNITDDITILFGTTPQIDLGVFDTLCQGQTVTLNAETPQVTYLWQDNSTLPTFTVSSPGEYYVTLDNNGCTNSDTTTISYFSAPGYTANFTNVVCSDECNGTISVLSNGGSQNFTYIWEDGSNLPERFDLCEGDYNVTILDDIGCTYEEFFTILNPEPLDFSISSNAVVCYGDDNGIIEVSGLTGGFPPYFFILNGDTLSGNTTIENLSGDTYEVVLSDSGGCTDSDTTFIYEPPFINLFAGDDRFIELGDTVHVNGFVYPIQNQVLSWNPIERFIGCLDCPTPEVQPIQTIEHVFTAIDSITGCVRSDSVILRVDQVREVYIPNAFSANFDGINDEFMIYAGPGVQQINSFKVFDRWGELIFAEKNFQPNDRNYGWNGMFNGKLMNNGVFVYVAEILFIDGKELLYSGDVTLLN